MATKEPGYVYILTNPSFREDWVKIGMTQNLEERLKNLDTTALPLPFKKFATLQTAKYQIAEKHVHHFIEMFTNLRIRNNREFFNVRPEQALKILCEVAELLDDAIVTRYDKGKPQVVYSCIPPCPEKPADTEPLKPAPRKPFEFSMIGLKEGDVVTFDPLKINVKIVGKNTITYEGQTYTLTGFCKAFLPQSMRTPSDAYQGPKFFSYQGVTLWKLRLRNEDKLK